MNPYTKCRFEGCTKQSCWDVKSAKTGGRFGSYFSTLACDDHLSALLPRAEDRPMAVVYIEWEEEQAGSQSGARP